MLGLKHFQIIYSPSWCKHSGIRPKARVRGCWPAGRPASINPFLHFRDALTRHEAAKGSGLLVAVFGKHFPARGVDGRQEALAPYPSPLLSPEKRATPSLAEDTRGLLSGKCIWLFSHMRTASHPRGGGLCHGHWARLRSEPPCPL